MSQTNEIAWIATKLSNRYIYMKKGKESFESFGFHAFLKLVDVPESCLQIVLDQVDVPVIDALSEYCDKHIVEGFEPPADVFLPGLPSESDLAKKKAELRPKYFAIAGSIKYAKSRKTRG